MHAALLLCLCFLLYFPSLNAQNGGWLFLKDKGARAESRLQQPQTFLSERALQRRALIRRAVDDSDLPVCAEYQKILAEEGCQILFASRWLNAVAVKENIDFEALQQKLPFVARFQPFSNLKGQTTTVTADDPPYGITADAFLQIGLNELHKKNLWGQGVQVGVFDSGFSNFNGVSAFDSLRRRGGLKAVYDFVQNDSLLFEGDDHGTSMVSVLSGYLPGVFIGGATEADLYLLRTETNQSETIAEEIYWQQAAEYADSAGLDLVSSSLSYNTFDGNQNNHTKEELDGQTAIITQAANAAADRGILIVNSAGNEGAGVWKKICFPCDAPNLLCVGSVTQQGGYLSISGKGPTADQRVKPDVAALGSNAPKLLPDGTPGYGTGTSLSTPIVAALAACLKSAFPQATHLDLLQAIRQSGSQANAPDSLLGYGIPNAAQAYENLKLLTAQSIELRSQTPALTLFPNPAAHALQALWFAPNPAQSFTLEVWNANGKMVFSQTGLASGVVARLALPTLPAGVYTVKTTQGSQTAAARLLLTR